MHRQKQLSNAGISVCRANPWLCITFDHAGIFMAVYIVNFTIRYYRVHIFRMFPDSMPAAPTRLERVLQIARI